MTETKKSQSKSNTVVLDTFCDAFCKALDAISKMAWLGVKMLPVKKWEFYWITFTIFSVLYVIAYSFVLFKLALKIFPELISSKIFLIVVQIPFHYQTLVMAAFIFIPILVILGAKPFIKLRKYQQALDFLSLKSGQGTKPIVLSVINPTSYTTRIFVLCRGIGLSQWENKKDALTTAFGEMVDSIKLSRNNKNIEINLCKKRLPEQCLYKDMLNELKTPYSFVVGESYDGVLTQNIRSLPHMLIAGSTGKGKSVFFKQTLLGLLKSSENIQMYLLDLKRGVEMKEFGVIPSVRIAKNEWEAVVLLKSIKEEMNKRFTYLEEKGFKIIDPKRDKFDIIIVGVDEASVLYTKSTQQSDNNENVKAARDLTDEIAKLGRAAGIHLILATQKVIKETIDTKVQENIEGKMCFRTNTMHGSLVVLGNKLAFELPEKPGRAIWSVGSKFIEVQAPFISDEDVKNECDIISKQYKDEERENTNTMIEITKPSTGNKSFAKNEEIKSKKK